MQISILDFYSLTRKQLSQFYKYCEPFVFKLIRLLTYFMMSEITSSNSLFEALKLTKLDRKGDKDEEIFEANRGPKINRFTIYGGELLAQALIAAQKTVDHTRRCSSIHCYFHLPSSTEKTNAYEVTKIRDGRTFSHRWSRVIGPHVDNPKKNSIVFQLDCSFRVLEKETVKFTPKMPEVARPEDCPSSMEFITAHPEIGEHIKLFTTYLSKTAPFEFRFDRPKRSFGLEFNEEGVSNAWVRLYPCSLPKAEEMLNDNREAILSYISDLFLLQSANRAGSKLDRVLSLNHTMWFHNTSVQLAFEDWLLFSTKTEHIDSGIALVSGSIYLSNGIILATMVQQGIMKINDSG